MKRALCLILIALLCAASACCETFDVSELSDHDLLKVYGFVQYEFERRFVNPSIPDITEVSDNELIQAYMLVTEEYENRFGTSDESSESEDLQDSQQPKENSWYDSGIGQYLPDPSYVLGRDIETDRTRSNSDQWFTEQILNCSEDEFYAYVDALDDFGFSNVTKYVKKWYEADNDAGLHVKVILVGSMTITAYPSEAN